MARRPARQCPRCRRLHRERGGTCADCARGQRAVADARRPNAAGRGYDHRWQQYARTYLVNHPVCVNRYTAHNGFPARSQEVDHIVPVQGPDDPRFWDESNHQALCKSCHSRKTARERRR